MSYPILMPLLPATILPVCNGPCTNTSISIFSCTARMQAQISDTALKGVLPVLLVFLAREQARVLEVHHWLMQPDGTMVEQPALGATDDLGHGIPGLRIVFEGPGSTGKQTLYYFQFNLQNSSFGRNQQFVDFIKKFGPLTTFTKAASYLLHSPNSSGIRQFILERSRYVVQGDSGIPLKYFAPALWNLKLYGTYTSPLALFKNRFQADLAAAYKPGQDVYPLPFGFGYHHRTGTANLLFATRKTGEEPR